MLRVHTVKECLYAVKENGRAIIEFDDSPEADAERRALLSLHENTILAFEWRDNHSYVVVAND